MNEEIERQLSGAWQLMMGRAEGLKLLDLTVDGFWNSFMAIVVALPALGAGWVAAADGDTEQASTFASRASLVTRLALIDLVSWILPLVLLALVARRLRIADRYVHYVVASNWATAIIAWLTLPPALLALFVPDASDLAQVLSLGLFGLALVFYWRMTNAALGKGAARASGVFAGMLAVSLAVLFAMDWLLDVVP